MYSRGCEDGVVESKSYSMRNKYEPVWVYIKDIFIAKHRTEHFVDTFGKCFACPWAVALLSTLLSRTSYRVTHPAWGNILFTLIWMILSVPFCLGTWIQFPSYSQENIASDLMGSHGLLLLLGSILNGRFNDKIRKKWKTFACVSSCPDCLPAGQKLASKSQWALMGHPVLWWQQKVDRRLALSTSWTGTGATGWRPRSGTPAPWPSSSSRPTRAAWTSRRTWSRWGWTCRRPRGTRSRRSPRRPARGGRSRRRGSPPFTGFPFLKPWNPQPRIMVTIRLEPWLNQNCS